MYRYVQVPGIINMYEIPGPGVLIIMLRRCIGINTPLHASVIKKTNILELILFFKALRGNILNYI